MIAILKIDTLKQAIENGEIKQLPALSNMGGYPLYYISSYGKIYCAECAIKLFDDLYEDIVDYAVHLEGDSIYCEHGHKIESAYGND